jgi:hypothetical protein
MAYLSRRPDKKKYKKNVGGKPPTFLKKNCGLCRFLTGAQARPAVLRPTPFVFLFETVHSMLVVLCSSLRPLSCCLSAKQMSKSKHCKVPTKEDQRLDGV